MRTGRELREAISDDEGRTWSPAQPRVFADLDVYRTELWADLFRGFQAERPAHRGESERIHRRRRGSRPAGAAERRPGRGVRRADPASRLLDDPKHPWNGNYLAFSLDHGDTWSHVVRLTSGVFTTHYMAVEETPRDNHLFVAYDFGHWRCKEGRYTYGRPAADFRNSRPSGLAGELAVDTTHQSPLTPKEQTSCVSVVSKPNFAGRAGAHHLLPSHRSRPSMSSSACWASTASGSIWSIMPRATKQRRR